MFGIALYSILTFMATVSLVLYLEECVYVYKKVPAPKKMTIIWVNGAAPVSTGVHRLRPKSNLSISQLHLL